MDAELILIKDALNIFVCRATVAFGLFPLPCFLSSRRLDLRTSLETLNSSSLRMFIFAL